MERPKFKESLEQALQKAFAKVIRSTRKRSGMNQKGFAESLNIDQIMQSRLERGKRPLKVIELFRLFRDHHVSIDAILKDVDDGEKED